MVRLFRGGGVRGRGIPRPPLMMPRHRPMRPPDFKPNFLPPFGPPRGLLRGHPSGRLGLPRPPFPYPHPPRLAPPLPRPLLPPHMPHPRRPNLMHPAGPGVPPFIPPVPHGRPIRPGMPLRGRGGLMRRGVTVKRLNSAANGRAKKTQKRKEKTEEMEVNKPWVTEALKVEIQKKYKLYETAKEKKNDNDWQAYKDQRTLVGKMTNTAKLEYIGSHPEAEFFCESCDRGWNTQEKLDEHLAQHEVCGRDGCSFTAHPKLVLKHVQIQHDTGLYKRIVFTKNPEDVDRWIAERKSRYPTKENVEKKDAQTTEMINRGERIPKQGKPFQDRHKCGNWRDRRQKTDSFNKPKINSPRKQLQKPTGSNEKWQDPNVWRGNLPQFPGTAAFPPVEENNTCEIKEEHFSDDEVLIAQSSCKTGKTATTQPLVSNVLALLMANYGSDMSENEDELDSIPLKRLENDKSTVKITHTILSVNNAEQNSINRSLSETINKDETCDTDSGPEECGIDREDKSSIPILSNENNLKTKSEVEPKSAGSSNSVKAPPARTPMKRHQLSLLEKLLKNEIRHERNVILQCVRYVVQNNFLN